MNRTEGGAFRAIIPQANVLYTVGAILGIPQGSRAKRVIFQLPITAAITPPDGPNNGYIQVGPNRTAVFVVSDSLAGSGQYQVGNPAFDDVDPALIGIRGTQAGDILYIAWGGPGTD